MMLFIHEYRKAKIEYKDELFRLFLQKDHEREQRGKDVNVQDIQTILESYSAENKFVQQGVFVSQPGYVS
jgi:hypothetical protein